MNRVAAASANKSEPLSRGQCGRSAGDPAHQGSNLLHAQAPSDRRVASSRLLCVLALISVECACSDRTIAVFGAPNTDVSEYGYPFSGMRPVQLVCRSGMVARAALITLQDRCLRCIDDLLPRKRLIRSTFIHFSHGERVG